MVCWLKGRVPLGGRGRAQQHRHVCTTMECNLKGLTEQQVSVFQPHPDILPPTPLPPRLAHPSTCNSSPAHSTFLSVWAYKVQVEQFRFLLTYLTQSGSLDQYSDLVVGDSSITSAHCLHILVIQCAPLLASHQSPLTTLSVNKQWSIYIRSKSHSKPGDHVTNGARTG